MNSLSHLFAALARAGASMRHVSGKLNLARDLAAATRRDADAPPLPVTVALTVGAGRPREVAAAYVDTSESTSDIVATVAGALRALADEIDPPEESAEPAGAPAPDDHDVEVTETCTRGGRVVSEETWTESSRTRYRDKDGDVWVETSPGMLRLATARPGALDQEHADVANSYGPLAPVRADR